MGKYAFILIFLSVSHGCSSFRFQSRSWLCSHFKERQRKYDSISHKRRQVWLFRLFRLICLRYHIASFVHKWFPTLSPGRSIVETTARSILLTADMTIDALIGCFKCRFKSVFLFRLVSLFVSQKKGVAARLFCALFVQQPITTARRRPWSFFATCLKASFSFFFASLRGPSSTFLQFPKRSVSEVSWIRGSDR